MAKWIYERWDLQWDFDAISFATSYKTNRGYFSLSRIDVVTLDPIAVTKYEEMKSDELFIPKSNNSYWSEGGSLSLFRPTKTGVSQVATNTSLSQFSKLAPPPRIKKSLLESDITAEEGTYPDDGIHTDGYWYVKVKKAFPTMRILRDGQWVEVEMGYVLQNGVWKPIEEIYKLQDGKWVQA